MTQPHTELAACPHCKKSMVPRIVMQQGKPVYSVCPFCAGTFKHFIEHAEIVRAKWPHELFLINLVFNHILVFASTFGVFTTFPLMVLIVPITSFIITGYILFKARKIAAGNETEFVRAHWVVADKRNKKFIWLLSVTCVVLGGGLWLSKLMGWSKIATIALLGGAGLLPFMVSLLLLIVLGNDSMYQARHGKFPKGYVPQNLEPQSSATPA